MPESGFVLSRVVRLCIISCCAVGAASVAASCSGDGPTAPKFGPPAALLIEGGQDQSGVVGMELPVALTARVVDAQGRPVPNRTVSFRVSAGGGTMFVGSAISSDSGIVRDRWTLGTTAADSQRIEVRTADAAGTPITAVFRALATPDVPAALVKVVGDAQTVVAGTPATDSLAVRVLDRYGNPVSHTTVRWAVTSGGGTLSTDSSVTAADGVARTRWTVGQQVGVAQRVTASVGTLSVQTFQATVQAAAAVGLAIVTPAAGAASGAPFTTAPSVRLVDAFNNTAAGSASAVTVAVSTGGTLSGTVTRAPTDGVLTFSGIGLAGVAGTYTLTYSATGMTSATQSISLTAGAASQLAITTQAAGALSGASFATQPVVELRDAQGNRTPSSAVVTVGVSAGANILGTATVAAIAGEARFTGVGLVGEPGSYTLTFSSPTLQQAIQAIEVGAGVKAVSAGFAHTMIVKTDGTLWATGRNHFGQFGDGTFTDRRSPVQVMAGIEEVSSSWLHTMLLKRDGTLWATGWNRFGQLGDGTTNDRSTPVQVMTRVMAVSAASNHTMILGMDDTLWATGRGEYGQLGNGSAGGGNILLSPQHMMAGVQAVSARLDHTMFLKKDGTLWAAGWNASGQLGDGTTALVVYPVQVMAGVKAVAAGSLHTMILKVDGTLWATGANDQGQLGDGTTSDRSTPVQMFTDVLAVSSGDGHSMILKTDGTLWATGRNFSGQLGDGTTTSRSTPVQVMTEVRGVWAGTNHTMILKVDGTLWATGANDSGQLGDGTTTNRSTPVQIFP